MLDLEGWRRGGTSYEHRGHRIYYRVEGSGEPLLLIHGFPTASWDWHRLWPELCARHRVIAADMIGFGFSDKPPRYRYSIFDQADLQQGLLAALGVERARVLAHDYGDTVAQELLARDVERRRGGAGGLRLLSVCLTNGGLFPEAHHARLIQRLLRTPLGPIIGRLMNERAFRRSMLPIFGPGSQPSPEELGALWRLVAERQGPRIAHRLIRYIDERQAHRARWVGALIDTQVPLRLIDGLADPISGRSIVARYRQLVPQPDVVELEGIGHYPQLEAPERVLQAFLEHAARPSLASA